MRMICVFYISCVYESFVELLFRYVWRAACYVDILMILGLIWVKIY